MNNISQHEHIASAFFRAGYIEAWGRGIEKMRSECQRAGIPAPHYNFAFGGLMLTFTAASTSETGEETREEIVSLIAASPSITAAEMAERIGISRKGIEWQITRLKRDGVLVRVGPTKGGYWKINEEE